jgi:hypothetical protein
MNYFKKIETIVIAVIILLLGVAYGLLNDEVDTPTTQNNQATNTTTQQQVASESLIRYSGQDGRTAMDILKANYNVQTQSFGDMGDFVKSIDGVEPDNKHFWALYVNGSVSQVGADQYVTKSSDILEWKLEEIK